MLISNICSWAIGNLHATVEKVNITTPQISEEETIITIPAKIFIDTKNKNLNSKAVTIKNKNGSKNLLRPLKDLFLITNKPLPIP